MRGIKTGASNKYSYERKADYGYSTGYGGGGGGGDHSGYGGGYDDHGGYSSGYGKKKIECCPLVVDPLTLLALLGSIAAATAFFNVLITMNIVGKKRRRKRSGQKGIEPQPDMRWQTLGTIVGDILLSGRMTWGLNDVARSKSHTGGVIVVMASD